jgi:DnaJ like chaperone protein
MRALSDYGPSCSAFKLKMRARGASQETIRKAYRLRIAMYHPDKVDHLGEEGQQLASEKTQELIRAYEMLRRRVLLRERM